MKLAGMTASVAGNYAATTVKGLFSSDEERQRLREERDRASGGRIAKTLGELKGAVMKVGQMASIAADVLPKELAESLGQLQKQAPPMSYEVIAEQIERELGAAPEVLFRRFDREPFASASIGQVHRAQVDDGREVVCKVQYPGVDGAVDSDLRHLRVALRASGLVNIGRKALNETFEELRTRLNEELDYTNEAQNVRFFQGFHQKHDFVKIPNVVGERSSARVLTLEYEPGLTAPEVHEAGWDQATRDQLGRNLFVVMASQLFEFGAIHGDPNPGNFAFREDGTVVIYDFGCVKRMHKDILRAYRDTIVAGKAEDYDALDQGLIDLGVRRPSGPPVEAAYYKQWRDIFTEPFLQHEVYDYGQADIHEKVMRMAPGAIKRMASFQPAKELIFVDRTVVGHYGNMRTLRSRIPVLGILEPYLEAFDGAALTGTVEAAPDPA